MWCGAGQGPVRTHCRGWSELEVAKKCTAEPAKGSLFDTARRKSHPPAVNRPENAGRSDSPITRTRETHA